MRKILSSIIAIVVIISASVPFISSVRAADPGFSVTLVSSGTKYVSGESTFDVNVQVNTGGNSVDTISLNQLRFDNTKLQLVSRSVQTLFASQAAPLADTSIATANTNGAYQLDIGKNPTTANYSNSSNVTFVRLTFRVISTGGGSTGSDDINIDYDLTPGTSGVFLSGVKITPMTVSNLTVDLAEDNTNPTISNCTPIADSVDNSVNTSVACDVTDLETGVSLANTTLTVNGVTYSNSVAPTFTSSSIANGYRVTVTPASLLPYASTITVSGQTQDNAYDNGPVLARNSYSLTEYEFDTEDDLVAPEIYSLNPASGAVNVPTNSDVSFRIRDVMPGGYDGMGVDIDSVEVTVTATGWGSTVYTNAGTNTFTTSGGIFDYGITVNPAIDFPQNTIVQVQIVASDLHVPGNNSVLSYSFITHDTNAPTCTTFSPAQGSTSVAQNGKITFSCIDTGVGVDIDTLTVRIDGLSYTKTGVNSFTYSGDSSEYIITVDPVDNFDNQKAFEVIINAEDLSNNQMTQIAYGLATGVGNAICPECETCNQCPTCPAVTACTDSTITVEIETPFTTTNEEMRSTEINMINDEEISLDKIFKIEKIDRRDGRLILIGTAKANAFVTLLIESDPIVATTIADADGKWRLNLPIYLITENVTHNIFAVSRNEKTGTIDDRKLLTQLEISYSEDNVPVEEKGTTETINWLYLLIAGVVGIILGVLITKYSTRDRSNKA